MAAKTVRGNCIKIRNSFGMCEICGMSKDVYMLCDVDMMTRVTTIMLCVYDQQQQVMRFKDVVNTHECH